MFDSITKANLRKQIEQFQATDDQDILDSIFRKEERLVRFIVNRFSSNHDMIDDLMQVGSIALVKAIRKFDPSRNIEFSTYATSTIRGEIRHYLRDYRSLIKVPRNLQEILFEIKQAQKKQSSPFSEPDPEALSNLLGISEEKIVWALEAERICRPISFLSSYAENEKELDEYIGKESLELARYLEYENVHFALSCLRTECKAIITLRYLGGFQLREICYLLAISYTHLERIRKGILCCLQNLLLRIEEGEILSLNCLDDVCKTCNCHSVSFKAKRSVPQR